MASYHSQKDLVINMVKNAQILQKRKEQMLQRLHLKELFEKPADSIKSTLYNYFDAYILVTGDAKVNEIIKMLHLKLVHRFVYETQKIFY